MMNDSTSDMLTRIRNAQMAMLMQTEVIYSKFNVAILEVMKKLKFISDYHVDTEGVFKRLFVSLSYVRVKIGVGVGRINTIKRVSKPGKRVYCDIKFFKHLDSVKNYIISTNKGVMDAVEAKKLGIGGEIICQIT